MSSSGPGHARTPAIVASDLRVRRGGTEVLRGLSFELYRGQVTGLIGPSGCGKTTLMRSIVGVQRGVEGELRVLDLPAGCAELRRRFGYVTQAPSVYSDLTVQENLHYFAVLAGGAQTQVPSVLDKVQLTPFAGRKVRDLSGGQQARVSLASALLGDPELLVLDEPTVGLDPLLRRELWRLFGELAGAGTTLLVSSHVLDEARHCDQLLLMRDGLLMARMTPAALCQQTGTDDLDEAFLRLITEIGEDRPRALA